MRVAIAVLMVVGCRTEKIDKADKLEPPRDVQVAPAPPPPPPPPITSRILIKDVPDPGMQDALGELLRPFPPALAICVVIDARGMIYATSAQDEAGARLTDEDQLKKLEELAKASAARPLTVRDETAKILAQTWVCTREPGAAPPQIVPAMTLEGRRVAGDKTILPDDATKAELARSSKDRIVTSWKLCIDERGAVTTAEALKASGFAGYDAKIERVIKEWKYQPYTTPAGRAVPVCTAVTFIYSQK